MKNNALTRVVVAIPLMFLGLWLMDNLIGVLPRNSGWQPPGHSPEGYSRTIMTSIKGKVIEHENGAGLGCYIIAQVKDTICYPFSFDIEKIPNSKYPSDSFIKWGDSVIKQSHTDTFIVIRGNQRWLYRLPVIGE